MSSEPTRTSWPKNWQHSELHKRVREAIFALPSYFRTSTNIEGISATDIFTLNSALGATIENQVVNTLNQMRAVWDPNEKYLLYSFVRQPQTFPDVLLRKSSTEQHDIILGIELKGWYLLAKEAEPSFRFQVTPAACASQDLIVVVPWALNNVISGSPQVFQPFIESARYAADYRNYHWKYLRQTSSDSTIIHPSNVSPYPRKSDQIGDKPVSDSGGNFGRFSRTGIMDNYLSVAKATLLCGIPAQNWLEFFKIFQDQKATGQIHDEILRLKNRYASTLSEGTPVEIILNQIENLLKE
ncbi:MAG: hypothetical protein HZB33_13830 [Nitrospirae bacterium]|nr:hypothetical protein [Nitrospirota bacterium]